MACPLRRDYVNAALSFTACVPVIGSVATGAKLTMKAVKTIDKASDLTKVFKNVGRAGGLDDQEKAMK